jgi:hypothetical protein
MEAPASSDTASNDLQFYRNLCFYRCINKTVADAAINKFQRHLWYLPEELVGLFSRKTGLAEKKNKNAEGIR